MVMRFYFARSPKNLRSTSGTWKAAWFMVGKNLWEPETYNIRLLWKVPLLPYAFYEKRLIAPARCIARGDRELPPDIAAKIPERPTDPALWAMPMDELRKAAGL